MLFDLKDDKVLKIQPIYTDSYYEEGCVRRVAENGSMAKSKLILNLKLMKPINM